jgi:hypothetical protein
MVALLLAGGCADRAARRVREDRVPPVVPPSAVRFQPDSFTGAAGFFRVGRDTAGRWWLVTPDDKPFFYRGVTSVNRAGRAGGRRAKDGLYAQTVDRAFDYQKSPSSFVESVEARLRSWGFNALGAWCEDTLFDRPQGLPYTEILEFNHTPQTLKDQGVNLPDVFDPEWAKSIDALCAQLAAPRKHSPMLVGYFTDNELTWLQPSEEDLAIQTTIDAPGRDAKRKPLLLQAVLSVDPARPAYAAAWEFVLSRHGNSVEQVGRAWGVALKDSDDVRKLTAAGDAIYTAGYMADQNAFSSLFAERYFRLSAEAIRRHDPNHLILGCRFGAPPGSLVLAQCRRPWVDVVSANNYRHTMYERIDEYHKPLGMPVLIGEFAWASDYFTRVPIDGEPDADGDGKPDASREHRMLAKGRSSLERAITHPGLVGYTWYRWVETGPDRRPPFMYGLVDTQDQPNPSTIQVLRTVHARADVLHAGEARPVDALAELKLTLPATMPTRGRAATTPATRPATAATP